MAKPRFVIDTNVLVSGILIFQSSSDQAYQKARSTGKILFSESSFQELEEILKRPKFNKYVSLESRNQFITKLKLESDQVTYLSISNAIFEFLILNFELIYYEQGADDVRIESYLKHWWQWVRTGVEGVLTGFVCWFGSASLCFIGHFALGVKRSPFLELRLP